VLFRWNDSDDLIRRAADLAQAAGVDELLFFRTTYPFFGVSRRFSGPQPYEKLLKLLPGSELKYENCILDFSK